MTCAVPASCFGNQTLSQPACELLRRLLRDLAAVERRLVKNVAVDDEHQRYMRLCRRIEGVTLGNSSFDPSVRGFRRAVTRGAFPVLRIGSAYVDLLREVHLFDAPASRDKLTALRASIIPPDAVERHLECFDDAAKRRDFVRYAAIRHRAYFLRRRVLPAGCGVVEVPDALSAPVASDAEIHSDAADGRSFWERLLGANPEPMPTMSSEIRRTRIEGSLHLPTATDWQEYGSVDNRGDFMEKRLCDQITAALAGGAPVNLTNQRHNMVTRILHKFIHREVKPPASAALTYNDGQEVAPFPLRCLERLPSSWAPTCELHVGLISMRHLQIDQYIDVNWYRNVEIPSSLGLAGADAYCYTKSIERLSALLEANRRHRVQVHLYHAGYLPAVVGFYRAVATLLGGGAYPKGALQIVPMLEPARGVQGFVKGCEWPERES